MNSTYTKRVFILIVTTIFLFPIISNAKPFIENRKVVQLYKEYRIYPRMDRAYKYIASEKYAGAEKLLLDVIKIDSEYTPAYEALINLYVMTNQQDKAKPYITKCTPQSNAVLNYYASLIPKMKGVKNPLTLPKPHSIETAYILFNRAKLLEKLGYINKAENILLNLNLHFPEYDQPKMALTELYLAQKDTAKALYYLSELPKDNELRKLYEPQRLSYIKAHQGKIVKPKPYIKSKKEIQEEKRYKAMVKVYKLIDDKKYAEAEKQLNFIVKKYGETQFTTEAYLVVTAGQRKYAEAEKYAKKLPPTSQTRSDFYFQGISREALDGNYTKSKEFLDSLHLPTTDTLYTTQLAFLQRAKGYNFLKNGKYNKAEQEFRNAIISDPTNEDSRVALVNTLILEKKFNDAQANLKGLKDSTQLYSVIAIANAQQLRLMGKSDSSLTILATVDTNNQKNEMYQAEKGYAFESLRMYDSASVAFTDARTFNIKEAQKDTTKINYGYTRAIAQALDRSKQRKEATKEYHRAIDEASLFAQNRFLDSNDIEVDKFNLQRANLYLNKSWDFNVTTLMRLDDYSTPEMITSAVQYASYTGFTFAEVTYSPYPVDNYIILFSSFLTSYKPQSLIPIEGSILGNFGIKSVPFMKVPFTFVIQYTINSKDIENYWMGTIAYGYSKGTDWNPTKETLLYMNHYSSASYIIDRNTTYLYYNGEIGPKFTFPTNKMASTITPYGTIGATMNTDNSKREAIYRLDGGLGVAFVIWGVNDPYKSYRMKNRISIEWRGAMVTNNEDKNTFRLKWEFHM